MKYKFGVTQWGMPGNGLYAVKLAKDAGLDGLQIELGSYEKGYPMGQKRIRDAYMEDGAKYGIEFPSLVLNDLTINDFVNGRDCEKGKIAYDQMKLGIEVAADMNVKVVMIPNFFDNFITKDEHYKNAAEEKGQSITESWLQANSEVDAIIAGNDQMALGAIEALKSSKKQAIVMGMDGTEDALVAVKEGTMALTLGQKNDEEVAATVNMLKLIKEGKESEIQDMIYDWNSITAENIDQYLNSN